MREIDIKEIAKELKPKEQVDISACLERMFSQQELKQDGYEEKGA